VHYKLMDSTAVAVPSFAAAVLFPCESQLSMVGTDLRNRDR
jgi:hypothetical protein